MVMKAVESSIDGLESDVLRILIELQRSLLQLSGAKLQRTLVEIEALQRLQAIIESGDLGCHLLVEVES